MPTLVSSSKILAQADRDAEVIPMSVTQLSAVAVEKAYHLCDGNVDKAAVELGIGRATMYRLLKKYKIMT